MTLATTMNAWRALLAATSLVIVLDVAMSLRREDPPLQPDAREREAIEVVKRALASGEEVRCLCVADPAARARRERAHRERAERDLDRALDAAVRAKASIFGHR